MLTNSQQKTANSLRRHHWFPTNKSEEREQKLHTHDVQQSTRI